MTTEATAARPAGASVSRRLPPSRVGSRRVEETLARMMSVFGLLFSLLTIPRLSDQWAISGSPGGLALALAVYGSVGIVGLSALLHQWARGVFLAAGIVYLGALLAWPLTLTGPWPASEAPWLLALASVPCGFVIVASSGALPVVYFVTIAASVAWLRAMPTGGGAPLPVAIRDGATVLVPCVAVWVIVTAVRRAARSVDRAQGAALGRYADAQIDEATESERVRTDALVHDSVLTTFLSAASAQTPEARALAARMAHNAMSVLSRATVASHVGPKVAIADLLDRVRRDAAGIGDRFEFQMRSVRDHFLPDAVADAVVSAAVQAMTNSVKHAGGPEVPRSLVVQGTEAGGVQVSIVDRGRGFDPSAVASERLGLRVSIMERMRRVGGEVDLRTAPGAGTEFVLSWPASAHETLAPADDDALAVLA